MVKYHGPPQGMVIRGPPSHLDSTWGYTWAYLRGIAPERFAQSGVHSIYPHWHSQGQGWGNFLPAGEGMENWSLMGEFLVDISIWDPWCGGQAPEPQVMATSLLRLILLTTQGSSGKDDPWPIEPTWLYRRVHADGYSPRAIRTISVHSICYLLFGDLIYSYVGLSSGS